MVRMAAPDKVGRWVGHREKSELRSSLDCRACAVEDPCLTSPQLTQSKNPFRHDPLGLSILHDKRAHTRETNTVLPVPIELGEKMATG